MQQPVSPHQTAAAPRRWYPFPFQDGRARPYRVSFLVAEEATWDHRFHDLDGCEISVGELLLLAADHRLIQASCDRAVGEPPINLAMPAANGNGSAQSMPVDAAASPA